MSTLRDRTLMQAGRFISRTVFTIGMLLLLLPGCRDAATVETDANSGVGGDPKQRISDVVEPSNETSKATPIAAMPVKLPRLSKDRGYSGSEVCRECHQSEHESWYASFHRSMTQVVSADSMAAPIDDIQLSARGRDYHFFEEDGAYWVEMIDPDWDLQNKLEGIVDPIEVGPIVKRRLVMSTGSHHYQTYWVNGKRGNHLWQVPWIYHLEEKRWIPAEDAFLTPPVEYHRRAEWNDNCVTCHSTHGSTQYDQRLDRFETEAAELGISCESCHGPAEDHVESHRMAAQEGGSSGVEAATLSPAGLDHKRSSDVCGQCHSFHMLKSPQLVQDGLVFRPGDKLTDHRILFEPNDEFVRSKVELRGGFWGDGTVRLAGREYSGMVKSSCFIDGEMACTSCHSMHDYESPEDQLKVDFRSDQACLQCHETMATEIEAHTHHAPQSSGSRCYNCHMPHTSFGLFKAMRSHRIDSPTAVMTKDSPKPNACNLCHNDRSLSWTSEYLAQWYGQPTISTNAFMDSHSISAVFLLSGDAVQRAVMAWNFGRPESREASGEGWQVPLLAQLLNDSYSMVRHTAWQALEEFKLPSEIQFDYLAEETDRLRAQKAILEYWMQQDQMPEASRQRVFQNPDGSPNLGLIKQLLKAQDPRPIILPE